MTYFVRRRAALAVVSLSIAGCGGGDREPHPVNQPEPASAQPLSPGQATGLPGEASAAQPLDLVEQGGTGRRGFWVGPRQRPPFSEWTMRQTAIDALARIGRPAVPALVDLLGDSDANLRAEAVMALARIGPEANGAIPQLITLVQSDPEEAVRKNAVRALGQIGPAAAPAVPVLIEQLRSEVVMPADNQPARRGERPAGEP